MTIGIIATLKIQPGTNEEFAATFGEMEKIVAEQEPGNLLYQVFRSRDDDSTYIVMEQYTDQAALDVHGKSDEFKAASRKLGGCMAGPPEIQLLDRN